MTILEPNQPWPQIEISVYDYSIGVLGGYKREIIDKPIIDLVGENISHYAYRHANKPTTLFVGPRARNKIKDLISRNSWLMNETTIKFMAGENQEEKRFLNMRLILTVDDGLWMA